jgi:hypothetical protein
MSFDGNQRLSRRYAALLARPPRFGRLPRGWLDELSRELDPIFRDVRPRRTVLARRPVAAPS